MRPHFLFAGISLIFMISTANAQTYSEGQVWSYKARKGEEASTVLINKVENNPKLGYIYHISVSGVSVKNRHAPSGVTQELPHFPVSQQTLASSCIKVVGHAKPNPGYLEGYSHWKHAFDQGNAGVFTIPVSEIVSSIESTINKRVGIEQ